MSKLYQVFVSHMFADLALYARLEDMLSQSDIAVRHFSVPVWNQIDAAGWELIQGLENRIARSSVVLVLIGPGMHKRPMVMLELELAARYGKKVIAVFPPGEFGKIPIPEVVDRQLYRAVGFRKDSIVRAIEGDYSVDTRVFDIAEEVDRRRLVSLCVSGVAIGTVTLLGTLKWWLPALAGLFMQKGWVLEVQERPGTPEPLAVGAATGLVTAGVASLIGLPPDQIVAAGASGFAAGTAVGAAVRYRFVIRRGSEARIIDVIPEPDSLLPARR